MITRIMLFRATFRSAAVKPWLGVELSQLRIVWVSLSPSVSQPSAGEIKDLTYIIDGTFCLAWPGPR